jgi:predicted Zn-dependent protease
VHTLRLLGDLVYREGDVDEAVGLWREALHLDPAALGPRLSLVTLYLNRGERDEARALLEAGLAQAPEAPALHYALGELAAQEDEHLLAARHFHAAADFRDAPLRVRASLSRLRDADRSLELGQQVEAAALLLDRSRVTNDADEAQRLRQEALELALAASNACEEQEPGAEVRAALARVLGQLAEGEGFALARQNLHRHQARILGPLGDRAHRLARAAALVAADQAALALRLLDELLLADARDAAALLARGDALLALGEPEAAIRAYELGLAHKSPASSDAWVYETLARLHLEARRPERGLKALRAALELAPGHPRLLREQGQLLLALERPGDALTAFRAYLEAALPGDPQRPAIERQVKALEDALR